ncbi:MAG: hypothetical protein ACO4AI_08050 [Prochlorothrix sp.]|nr:hypothetical protein [Prochlorothrix sp.]
MFRRGHPRAEGPWLRGRYTLQGNPTQWDPPIHGDGLSPQNWNPSKVPGADCDRDGAAAVVTIQA